MLSMGLLFGLKPRQESGPLQADNLHPAQSRAMPPKAVPWPVRPGDSFAERGLPAGPGEGPSRSLPLMLGA